MRINRFILAVSCCIWVNAAQAEQKTEQITLTLQDYPPYMGESLPHKGLLTRLVVAAFEQKDIAVKLESVPNKRAIDGVRQGIYQGGFGWAKNAEREKDLIYSDPVLSLSMVFCQQKGREIKWKKLEDLASYKIGVTAGNFYSDDFDKLSKSGLLQVDVSNSDVSNFKKLSAGYIDLLPIDIEVGPYVIAKNLTAADQNKIVCQSQAYWSAPLHVVFDRKNPNSPRWAKTFNDGLRILSDTGLASKMLEATRREINRSN
ncbi:transporter substrate-binding domain-containing protein [Chitinibacter fontanus]|uniref:Transporter substrate-binding domain-containing protein n=1 Tax=Chitinibacter fontanus TaxID=1737446 RepID=A0A7D5VBZ6_9NEIS|nr:transporter substrate-binding domain-containing protein [Chitinibacter fontanus]QLI82812.1 transporter substrate-binding domain-containing protein [Chitinibacter fontanus]